MANQNQNKCHGKPVIITYDPETKVFTAKLEDGDVVATGVSGAALGKLMWNEGAYEVQKRYNLVLDE